MNRRYSTTVIIIAITSVFTTIFSIKTPAHAKAVYAKKVPLNIEGWVGIDMPLSERDIEILETDDVVTRAYVSGASTPIYLGIVFAKDNRKVAHPPEICYAGGGWSVEDKRNVKLDVTTPTSAGATRLETVQLIIQKGDEEQLVLYWFKCGPEYTASYIKQQLNIALAQITMRESSGALIRVSTRIENDDVAGAFSRAEKFARAVLPFVSKYLP